MAKTSWINRNNRKRETVKKYAALRAELKRLIGDRFSPTALEDYVACPFRFFMRHLLRLDPLDEPTEEVEVTRRGMTVHRALARLHLRLRNET